MKTLKPSVKEVAEALAARLLQEAETKRIFKEALTEWMDRKFLEFSKDVMKGGMVLLFGALVVVVMWSQGYHK